MPHSLVALIAFVAETLVTREVQDSPEYMALLEAKRAEEEAMKALATADRSRTTLLEVALSAATIADQRMLGAAHEQVKELYLAWAMAPEAIGLTLKDAVPDEWATHERQWQEHGEFLEFLREVAPKEVEHYEKTTAAVAVAAHEFVEAYPDSWATAAGVLAEAAPVTRRRRQGPPPV